MLETMCFKAKAWSTNEIVWGLIFFLILFSLTLNYSWSSLVLILRQCLTFKYLLKQPCCLILLWHHQNPVFIHSHSPLFDDDNQVISFRHHQNNAWSTFSPFLMMTLIIKQILFDIIKTCMIYILYFSFSVWDSLRRTLGFSNPLSPFHPSSCEPSLKSPNGTTKAPLTTTTPLSQRQSSRTDKTQSKTIIKSNHQRHPGSQNYMISI